MQVDEIYDVDDWSEITVRAMIARLEQSTTPEQFVYRETELDEMWRLVDIALKDAKKFLMPERIELARVRDLIMTAHDLVGVEGRPLDAAATLRAIHKAG